MSLVYNVIPTLASRLIDTCRERGTTRDCIGLLELLAGTAAKGRKVVVTCATNTRRDRTCTRVRTMHVPLCCLCAKEEDVQRRRKGAVHNRWVAGAAATMLCGC